MVQIIGNKDEVNAIAAKLNDKISSFTTYEHVDQEKNTFQVQCKCNKNDLDYTVKLTYN